MEKEDSKETELKVNDINKNSTDYKGVLLAIFIMSLFGVGYLFLISDDSKGCFMGLFGDCMSSAYFGKAVISILPCLLTLISYCANNIKIDKYVFIIYSIYNAILVFISSTHVRDVSLICLGYSVLILIIILISEGPKDENNNEIKENKDGGE